MSASWGIVRHGAYTVEQMNRGIENNDPPQWWICPQTGFFWANYGRWREFGFCAGRMRWDWRYAAWIMRRVKSAVEFTRRRGA